MQQRAFNVLLIMASLAIAFFSTSCNKSPSPSSPMALMNLQPDALLPVLRREDPDSIYAQTIVHRPLGAGVGVYLAQVGPTPRGTIGINYVLQHQTDWKSTSVHEAFETAWRNFKADLKISGIKNDGATFFSVEHPSGVAAAALGLPGFRDEASQWVGSSELFIAVLNPSTLLVAAPGGLAEKQLRATTHQYTETGAVDLDPGCYILSPSGLRVAPMISGT
jgi:hypothetical protein